MSGVSYTQYFAQEPFAQGMRLFNCKDDIWGAFGQLLPPGMHSKKGFKLEVPMLHIACSAEQALRRLGLGEAWEEVMAPESWLQMVAKTGFTDHMRKIS